VAVVGMITAQSLSPIIPPRLPALAAPRAQEQQAPRTVSLPLPDVRGLPHAGLLHYGLARIDASGRISERPLLQLLGWRPGDRLVLTVLGRAVVVSSDPSGIVTVGARLSLVLPAPARRRCGIAAGDRILLAADPNHGVLVVHPLSTLDSLITSHHSTLLGGDERDDA
jgi:bifunctional DNA-binding transcriptional regulator/antitoxin component of YhaV-PrlF toxin-antitoxin module